MYCNLHKRKQKVPSPENKNFVPLQIIMLPIFIAVIVLYSYDANINIKANQIYLKYLMHFILHTHNLLFLIMYQHLIYFHKLYDI